jgi:hypothetical protein
MSNFTHGFLSEPLGEVRHAVHKRYTNYRNILMRLNEQCVATQYELPIKADDPRELLGATFFLRTIASSQAAVILLEHGLIAQAKAVLRSALESLFALAAIEAKPELALLLAQSQEANKRSLADKMLQWESDELKASRDGRITEEELLKLKSSKAREFTTWQLAEAAGMVEWYRSLYALLSQPAHATVSDITAHLVTDKHGNITQLQSEPEVEGQEATWAFTIEIQLRAAKAIANMFGVNSINISDHENALRIIVT